MPLPKNVLGNRSAANKRKTAQKPKRAPMKAQKRNISTPRRQVPAKKTTAKKSQLPTAKFQAKQSTKSTPKRSFVTIKKKQTQQKANIAAIQQLFSLQSTPSITKQQDSTDIQFIQPKAPFQQQYAAIANFARKITRPATSLTASNPVAALQNSANPVLREFAQTNFQYTPVNMNALAPAAQVPVFTPLRSFASKVPAKNAKNAKTTKKPYVEEEEGGGEELFMSAGDAKKQVRNWLEQILTSKPKILPLPAAAKENEELFVKECQVRFAQRLDKRSRYEQAKIIVKQRAIEALPGELKTEALKDDDSLWSLQIIQPWSHPPRQRWLMEHFEIPYKASVEEIEEEEFIKKKYARF